MGPLQIVLGTISVLFLIVSVVFAYRAVRAMVRIIRTGQPDSTRTRPLGPRLRTLLVESLGHTRMLKWSSIGVAHWFVFLGFYGLFLTLVEAFGEVWNPAFHLPLIAPRTICRGPIKTPPGRRGASVDPPPATTAGGLAAVERTARGHLRPRASDDSCRAHRLLAGNRIPARPASPGAPDPRMTTRAAPPDVGLDGERTGEEVPTPGNTSDRGAVRMGRKVECTPRKADTGSHTD